MMILDDEITIQWATRTKQHYLDKGYAFTKIGDFFTVKVKDLPEKSGKEIRCKCDYCGSEFSNDYSIVRLSPHACKNCRSKKAKETNKRLYGVESCSQLESVKKKKRETFLSHYPTKESRKEMRKRLEDTREKNTGYRSPFHNPSVRDKARKTLISKTGYDNPWKDSSKKHDTQVKIAKTLNENQTVRMSEQQKQLMKMLNASPGKNIDIYVTDMMLGNVVIEYDGGGHFVLGKIRNSEQEMIEKEHARDSVIVNSGYKIIHIISRQDKLPKQIKHFVDKCITYLKAFNVVYLDIDNEEIRCNSNVLEKIQFI